MFPQEVQALPLRLTIDGQVGEGMRGEALHLDVDTLGQRQQQPQPAQLHNLCLTLRYTRT